MVIHPEINSPGMIPQIGAGARVCLDTNALRSLFDGAFPTHDLLRLRRRLSSPLFRRRPTILIGIATLYELAKFPETAKRHRIAQLDFLVSLPDLSVASIFDRCVRSEIQWGRAQLLPCDLKHLLVTTRRGHYLLEDEILFARELNETWTTREERNREDLGGPLEAKKKAAQSLEQIHADTLEVCLRKMEENKTQWGLPHNRVEWPSPAAVPTLWHAESFLLARKARVQKNYHRSDPNDLLDQVHYIAAASADVLVTDDKRFRETVELCPPPRLPVMSSKQFAWELLRDVS